MRMNKQQECFGNVLWCGYLFCIIAYEPVIKRSTDWLIAQHIVQYFNKLQHAINIIAYMSVSSL